MAKRRHLVLFRGDVAREGHPVRELAGVFDRNELQIELELRASRAPRGDLGFERTLFEDMLQQSVGDRLLALDDSKRERRLANDVFAPSAKDRAEAVVHEGDPRADRLDGGRHDGDSVGRHVNRGAEQTELLGVHPLLRELTLETVRNVDGCGPRRVQ